MYIPKFNAQEDQETLFKLIEEFPFASWACNIEGEIEINHLPLYLRRDQGSKGTLVGHVARPNPIWKHCDGTSSSTFIFHGEQAYISPSWYPSKQNDPKVVPTWNYVVVHAKGKARAIEDTSWLLQHLQELTNKHEQPFDQPWKVSDAPEDFIEKLSKAIVGIEIPVDKLEGKWKLGQNRSEVDQQGLMSGLRSLNSDSATALAERLSNAKSK